MTLRTTVYLDENVIEQVRRFIPQRGLSQLVNDLLQQKVAELEKAEIEAQMREGYLASRQERALLMRIGNTVEFAGVVFKSSETSLPHQAHS